MDSDSFSVSSKIKELYDLKKSGLLSDEEYFDQLKRWITGQIRSKPVQQKKSGIGESGLSDREFRQHLRKLKKPDPDLINIDMITKNDDAPVKEKVEKILWTHLN